MTEVGEMGGMVYGRHSSGGQGSIRRSVRDKRMSFFDLVDYRTSRTRIQTKDVDEPYLIRGGIARLLALSECEKRQRTFCSLQ